MKRWIACLMACMLAAFALNAWAAEYTLDEKLIKQVKDGSGLKVTVKMDKTGGSFTSLDAQTNLALNALLPGAELSLRFLRGVGTIKGMQDLEITLTKGGEALAGMRSLRDTQFESLTSSLLGGITYADVRGGGALMAMLLDQDPAWPPLEGVLLKLLLAESTWQTAANRKLDAYQLKLSLWLQGFTQTETVRAEDNTLRTRVLVSVPAAQLKNQIKQLLVDMFNDAELLSLLSRGVDIVDLADAARAAHGQNDPVFYKRTQIVHDALGNDVARERQEVQGGEETVEHPRLKEGGRLAAV